MPLRRVSRRPAASPPRLTGQGPDWPHRRADARESERLPYGRMACVNERPAEVGALAPDFELRDQHGSPVKLSGFRGRKVVLVFYPLAFSGVCHRELSALRDAQDSLADAELLTVSVDSMFTH